MRRPSSNSLVVDVTLGRFHFRKWRKVSSALFLKLLMMYFRIYSIRRVGREYVLGAVEVVDGFLLQRQAYYPAAFEGVPPLTLQLVGMEEQAG